MRGAEAEAAASALVEGGGDLVAARLSEVGERDAFGRVLADEAVGVLVGAAFPSVVRRGEVDFQAEDLLQELVAVNLDAVVGGEGAPPVGFWRSKAPKSQPCD